MSDSEGTVPVRKRRAGTRSEKIACVGGPERGRTWAVTDRLAIGIAEGNAVVLTDPTVSRRHAELIRTANGFRIRDLGSTNGTWVGEVQIREAEIPPDARFRVGSTELMLAPDERAAGLPSERTELGGLVGGSRGMREVFGLIERMSRTGSTVLITGETGTGKELVARALHDLSDRHKAPFVVFDCGAVAPSLVEAQLFGHSKGAFTGAVEARPGVFEAAKGGTVFLDELGELPIELQPKLLRALEARTVTRVGETNPRPIDVRVVAATHRDLQSRIADGTFRADLYYRLAVVEIGLPPLRERKEDLALLVSYLLRRLQGRAPSVVEVDPQVIEVLAAWRWPGNVRELANTIERALPFCEGPVLKIAALPPGLRSQPIAPEVATPAGLDPDQSFKDAKEQWIEAFERRYWVDLCASAAGNVSKMARVADVDRKTVRRMLEKYGLRGSE